MLKGIFGKTAGLVAFGLYAAGCVAQPASGTEASGATLEAVTSGYNSGSMQTTCDGVTVGQVIQTISDNASGESFAIATDAEKALWATVVGRYSAVRYVNLTQKGIAGCQNVFAGRNTMLFFKLSKTEYTQTDWNRFPQFGSFQKRWENYAIANEFWFADASIDWVWIGFDPGGPNRCCTAM